ERLRACGVRPINNIVDITNYVMLEYGQPMHAFDLRYVDGASIIVREAKDGEKITTLDGIERNLKPGMLVIADENKPIAVAGVMGGEYSGIMDDTTTIVFESACFNGPSTRVTARNLGLRTEASGRYEKELDPASCMPALCRALELIQELDAGDVVNGIIDCDKSNHEVRTLPFEPEWVNNFIGISVPADEQKKILEKIDFKVEDGVIYIPSYRNDIEHKADISEEIARFNGYQNIPDRALAGVACAKLTPRQKLEKVVNATMLASGFTEISTYSFISPKAYDKILLPADSKKRDSVVISNPLGEDTSVMRTTAVPSMLEVLSRNYNNRNEEAYLYELATDYTSRGTEELPIEGQKVIIGMYGEKADFYSLKGAVEELLDKTGVYGWDIEPVKDNPTFHPGRTAVITVNGKELAVLGEIHPAVAANYEIEVKAYAACVDFDVIAQESNLQKTYKPLPKFPASTRDLAFVCEKDVPVITLEKAIKEAAGKLLEKIELFDVYEGSQIPDGYKSVAFNLRLRSAERTLTDEEADAAVKRAVKALAKLGITLRS
ncbi:MAG: phenylalanine--tRNA ligase subunit beta, partial [Clostridia bacterium]|nr:phenylalanine--tRNA ligase subunit beta [Clostridia bacterium]